MDKILINWSDKTWGWGFVPHPCPILCLVIFDYNWETWLKLVMLENFQACLCHEHVKGFNTAHTINIDKQLLCYLRSIFEFLKQLSTKVLWAEFYKYFGIILSLSVFWLWSIFRPNWQKESEFSLQWDTLYYIVCTYKQYIWLFKQYMFVM